MNDNKLVTLIANEEISVEELANAPKLIDRASFVVKAIEACKKTLVFSVGTEEIGCYTYTDRAGEYYAWGNCTHEGVFRCCCNWGGDHEIGRVNILSFKEVFLALNDNEFEADLTRFLNEQIEKVEGEAR